ncbi:unnamed protein product [Urochloa humidicola]
MLPRLVRSQLLDRCPQAESSPTTAWTGGHQLGAVPLKTLMSSCLHLVMTLYAAVKLSAGSGVASRAMLL